MNNNSSGENKKDNFSGGGNVYIFWLYFFICIFLKESVTKFITLIVWRFLFFYLNICLNVYFLIHGTCWWRVTTSASDVIAVRQDGGVLCADRGIDFWKMWELQREFKDCHVAAESTGEVKCNLFIKYKVMLIKHTGTRRNRPAWSDGYVLEFWSPPG